MVEKRGRGRIRRAGAVALMAGAMTAMAVPAAHASEAGRRGPAIHTDGYEPSSVITRGRCKGWINSRVSGGHFEAQGLAQSWEDTYYCNMILQVRHGSGSYQKVSNEYQADGDQVHTGYHRDDTGYKARVCIWGKNDIGWHCGAGV